MAGFDQIGKDTGPGKIANFTDTRGDVLLSFLLFNYNIDGNVLKPEHKKFLDEQVVPFLREHKVHTELVGTTSKTGTSDYDVQMSIGRVLRVKQYLASKGIGEEKLPGPDILAAGKSLSTSKLDEDGLDRAVRLTIVLRIKPRPLFPTIVVPMIISGSPPPPVDLPPAIQTPPTDEREHWTIRQIFGSNTNVGVGVGVPGAGVGVGVGPVDYSFLLVNRKTHKMAQCNFAGPGVSAGVGPNNKSFGAGLSLGTSITGQSKTWNNFTTAKGVDFPDFDGKAAWAEPGGVALGTDISANAKLALPDLGVKTDITTGKTIGFPGSAISVGRFHCGKPVQLHLPN